MGKALKIWGYLIGSFIFKFMEISENSFMNKQHDKFALLLDQNRSDLRQYIYSLCHNNADTEDILQETSSALWRKFDSYDPRQAFIYWALRFAYFEVMKFRDRQKKADRLCKTTLKVIAKECEDNLSENNDQKYFLKFCTNQLELNEKKLVDMHYNQKLTIKSINDHFGEKGKKIYRAFERIRFKLFKCMEKARQEEAGI